MAQKLSPEHWANLSGKGRAALRMQFLEALAIDKDLTDTERRIGVLLITRYLNHDAENALAGHCWPSQERLAEELGIKRETALRATRTLCEKGWFMRHLARLSKQCRNKGYVYRPVWERVSAASPFAALKGDNPVPERVSAETVKGDNRNRERVSAASPDSFEEPTKETLEETRARDAAPPLKAGAAPALSQPSESETGGNQTNLARQESEREKRRAQNRETWWAKYRTPETENAPVRLGTKSESGEHLKARAITMRRVLRNNLSAPRQPSSGRYLWNRTHIDECERAGHLAAGDAKALRVRMGFEV